MVEARSLHGKLLVASPLLGDPNFRRSVVLVLAHGVEGALGVVINRPTDTVVGSPLPAWAGLATEPGVVFVGGPVSDSAICLGRLGGRSAPPKGFVPVLGSVGTVDLSADPGDMVGALTALRVFAGYAGWAPDQLETEMDAGAWWSVDPAEQDFFSPKPDELWRRVLRRQGGELALVAAYPDDPRCN